MPTGFDELERLLARSIGLDPASLGASSLSRAVEHRLKALGMAGAGVEAYVRRVRASTEEFQELVEELVVPETWFFRDGRPFLELRRHAAAWATVEGANRNPFRALSLPCSTGEEPYSIAITLLDLGLPRERFAIDAVDLSTRALERARRGLYGARSLRTIDPTVRDRYFRPQTGGCELVPEVRQAVRFHHGNLVDPHALKGAEPYDVIFSRNLLIYFDVPARRRAIETLDRLLSPTGLLFVGHAERQPLLETRFVPQGPPGCFCYGKRSEVAVPPRKPHAASPAGSTTRSVPGVDRKPTAPTTPAGSSPGNPRRGRPPTQPVANHPPASTPPESRASNDPLIEAAALANRHEYRSAAAICKGVIAQRGPSADVFHLLGAICQASGDLDDAEGWLGKAVYLDAEHEDALLALALIAGRRGDRAAADRYRRRADRARNRKKTQS